MPASTIQQQIVVDKKLQMLRGHFPRVQFNGLKELNKNSHDYCPEEILDALDPYIDETENGQYNLNIPRMVNNDLFKPLFPDLVLVRKYATEINKMNNPDKRLNIVKFFVKKEDENFATELNAPLSSQEKIVPCVTLTEQFFKDFKKKYLCFYSPAVADNGNSRGEFLWDFGGKPLLHDETSIYWAFKHYAYRNITLYLFGLDFYKFKNKPSKWPSIKIGKSLSQKLPDYFSESGDPSKGLSKQIKEKKINAFDFIWENSAWTETDSIKYLLKRFELNEKLKISLKDIYNSFCIPILYDNNFTNLSKKIRFNTFRNLGLKIIENTLLRRPDLAVKKILLKNDYIFKKLELNLKHEIELKNKFSEEWPDIWEEAINQILENKPKKNQSKYKPLEFLTFLKRVSVFSNYNYANRFNEIQKAPESNILNPKERRQIKEISEKNLNGISTEVLDELHITGDLKYGKAYEKLNSLIELMESCEKARDTFPDEYEIIKAFDLKKDTHSPDVIINGRELSIFDTIKSAMPEPEDALLQKEQEIEVQKDKEKIMRRLEPVKKSIIECFENEFPGENDWLSFIRKKTECTDDLLKLWNDMDSYPPRSAGHLSGARKSRMFMDYCTISCVPYNQQIRGNCHTNIFVPRMRNIADELINRGYKR